MRTDDKAIVEDVALDVGDIFQELSFAPAENFCCHIVHLLFDMPQLAQGEFDNLFHDPVERHKAVAAQDFLLKLCVTPNFIYKGVNLFQLLVADEDEAVLGDEHVYLRPPRGSGFRIVNGDVIHDEQVLFVVFNAATG